MCTSISKWPLTMLIFVTGVAYAGPAGTSGGKGYVCRDSQGKINKPVQLLDLWEAKEIFGREIKKDSRPALVQFEEALERLKGLFLRYRWQKLGETGRTGRENAFKDDVRRKAMPILDSSLKAIRKRDAELPLTNDSWEEIKPKDTASCKIEQIVRYNDHPTNPMIYINQEIVDSLDNTTLAALALHEGLYVVLRNESNQKERSSVRTRRAVGYVMSGGSFVSSDVLKNPHFTCYGELDPISGRSGTKIHFVQTEVGNLKVISLVPEQIADRWILGFNAKNLSGRVLDLASFFKLVEDGFVAGEDLQNFESSIVDFDIEGRFRSDMNFSAGAMITLNHMAPGLLEKVATSKVKCHSPEQTKYWEELEP